MALRKAQALVVPLARTMNVGSSARKVSPMVPAEPSSRRSRDVNTTVWHGKDW